VSHSNHHPSSVGARSSQIRIELGHFVPVNGCDFRVAHLPRVDDVLSQDVLRQETLTLLLLNRVLNQDRVEDLLILLSHLLEPWMVLDMTVDDEQGLKFSKSPNLRASRLVRGPPHPL